MQTAWPFRSATSSTGQHASTCSIARLNPLVQTRSKTRYNMPPAVCFTATRGITTNNHDFSLGKTALGLFNLTKRDRGTPVYRAKFEIQPTRWRSCTTWGSTSLHFSNSRLRFVSTFPRSRFKRMTSFHDERGTPIKSQLLSHAVNIVNILGRAARKYILSTGFSR